MPLALSTSFVRWYPLFGTAATNAIEFVLEQRTHTVPPCDVIAVLFGVATDVVVVPLVAGGFSVAGGPTFGAVVGDTVAGGFTVDEVGDEPSVVGDDAAVVVGDPARVVVDPDDDVVALGPGVVVDGAVSSRSTPLAVSRWTLDGATRFSTRPTAANARLTLAPMPSSHREMTKSPRLTS